MNHENKYNIHSVDDGYLLLAGMVVHRALEYYNYLLQKYYEHPDARRMLTGTIRQIEEDLCSDYYYCLTFGAVDFPAYIKCLHEKYHIPWEDTEK